MNGKRQTAKCKLMCTHKYVHAKFRFCEFYWMTRDVLPCTFHPFLHCIRQIALELHWTVSTQFITASMPVMSLFCVWRARKKGRQQTDIINRLYRIRCYSKIVFLTHSCDLCGANINWAFCVLVNTWLCVCLILEWDAKRIDWFDDIFFVWVCLFSIISLT